MSSALTTGDVKAAAPAERRKNGIDSRLLCGVFGLLLFGPIAFGAVDAWATWVLEVGATLLFALWARKQWLTGELRLRENPLYLPMAAFGATVLLQIVFDLTSYWRDTFSEALLYAAYAVLAL